jgi:5-methylcytosine-specific restriction enzyme A
METLYHLTRWERICQRQLEEHPLCVYCLERAIVTPATIVERVEPHRGAISKLQSLCRECHEATKRDIKLYGYRTDIGLDGYPLDPRHPVYRRCR